MKHLLAQLDPEQGKKIIDPRTIDKNNTDVTPQVVISNVIEVAVVAISVGAVLSLIYGGITYVTAGGDPEKAERGKRVIIYSVSAIVLLSAAYLIYEFVIKGVQTGQI